MNYNEIYKSKLGTVDEALSMIKSGMTVAGSIYACEATQILKSMHKLKGRVKDVTLWTMLMMGEYPVMNDNSLKDIIDVYTFFYNGDCRRGHESGRFNMVPMNLHSVAADTINAKRPNMFIASVSPMDEDGNFHFSFDMQASKEWLDTADIVVFEVNKNMPIVLGDTAVSVTVPDLLIETDTPMPIMAPIISTKTEEKIASYVADIIKDGDCLQLGIGGMPNAVGDALTCKKDLGIHTEMITSSMGKLIRSGAVTNERKSINRGVTIGAFAWGDQELYDIMENNPKIQLRRASYTNDPFIIAQNDNMVSVNTAIEVDLTGQICSESVGAKQFSGTGGASDFAYGAYHSKGGKGIIALASTTKNGTISKIKPILTPGSVVSISRNIVDYVITEYGVAKLKGKTVGERVNNLISVAHPDFRDELRRTADKLMLW